MVKTVKKGSITIFLALILSLILSLVSASIESVRMSAARTQILNSMDIGLYSLFGQYDRTLLEDYDLFALYAGGKEEPDMASVYENFQIALLCFVIFARIFLTRAVSCSLKMTTRLIRTTRIRIISTTPTASSSIANSCKNHKTK